MNRKKKCNISSNQASMLFKKKKNVLSIYIYFFNFVLNYPNDLILKYLVCRVTDKSVSTHLQCIAFYPAFNPSVSECVFFFVCFVCFSRVSCPLCSKSLALQGLWVLARLMRPVLIQ